METTKKANPKKEILKHLKQIKRPLAWLSDVTDIPYGTIYAIFIQGTVDLTQERLDKINIGLQTDFKS